MDQFVYDPVYDAVVHVSGTISEAESLKAQKFTEDLGDPRDSVVLLDPSPLVARLQTEVSNLLSMREMIATNCNQAASKCQQSSTIFLDHSSVALRQNEELSKTARDLMIKIGKSSEGTKIRAQRLQQIQQENAAAEEALKVFDLFTAFNGGSDDEEIQNHFSDETVRSNTRLLANLHSVAIRLESDKLQIGRDNVEEKFEHAKDLLIKDLREQLLNFDIDPQTDIICETMQHLRDLEVSYDDMASLFMQVCAGKLDRELITNRALKAARTGQIPRQVTKTLRYMQKFIMKQVPLIEGSFGSELAKNAISNLDINEQDVDAQNEQERNLAIKDQMESAAEDVYRSLLTRMLHEISDAFVSVFEQKVRERSKMKKNNQLLTDTTVVPIGIQSTPQELQQIKKQQNVQLEIQIPNQTTIETPFDWVDAIFHIYKGCNKMLIEVCEQIKVKDPGAFVEQHFKVQREKFGLWEAQALNSYIANVLNKDESYLAIRHPSLQTCTQDEQQTQIQSSDDGLGSLRGSNVDKDQKKEESGGEWNVYEPRFPFLTWPFIQHIQNTYKTYYAQNQALIESANQQSNSSEINPSFQINALLNISQTLQNKSQPLSPQMGQQSQQGSLSQFTSKSISNIPQLLVKQNDPQNNQLIQQNQTSQGNQNVNQSPVNTGTVSSQVIPSFDGVSEILKPELFDVCYSALPESIERCATVVFRRMRLRVISQLFEIAIAWSVLSCEEALNDAICRIKDEDDYSSGSSSAIDKQGRSTYFAGMFTSKNKNDAQTNITGSSGNKRPSLSEVDEAALQLGQQQQQQQQGIDLKGDGTTGQDVGANVYDILQTEADGGYLLVIPKVCTVIQMLKRLWKCIISPLIQHDAALRIELKRHLRGQLDWLETVIQDQIGTFVLASIRRFAKIVDNKQSKIDFNTREDEKEKEIEKEQESKKGKGKQGAPLAPQPRTTKEIVDIQKKQD
ncbi:MAG: hypothetical protein EZS28_024022, partial [Streblomastix strix]